MSLKELYVGAVDELYSFEQHLIKLVMELANETSEPLLKKRFELHFEQTYDQLMRLEKILRGLGTEPTGRLTKTMEGLMADADDVVASTDIPAVKDARLLAVAQRIEHYEIASYACATMYAQVLGETATARILQRTLDEEIQEEKQLTALASLVVTRKASSFRRQRLPAEP